MQKPPRGVLLGADWIARISLAIGLYDLFRRSDQGWNIFLTGFPQDFLVQAEILVHQNIANSLYLSQGTSGNCF